MTTEEHPKPKPKPVTPLPPSLEPHRKKLEEQERKRQGNWSHDPIKYSRTKKPEANKVWSESLGKYVKFKKPEASDE